MAMTRKQAYLAGKERRDRLPPGIAAKWNDFSIAEEFKRYAARHELTTEEIEAYRKGFCDEIL
ncbi:MAG: hypothetical protein ABFC88_12320 [Thermoguttaceae bacterium]